MKALIQRVSSASVEVGGKTVGEVGRGLLVFLGVAKDDDRGMAERLAGKIANARVFEGDDGHFDLSLIDVEGKALIVSQFTLCARTKKGRRPSLDDAARPEEAEVLYEYFCEVMRDLGVGVATGRFGASMRVHLVNEGPVTFLYET